MSRKLLAGAALIALVACGKGDRKDTAMADSTSRDLQLAPTDSTSMMNDKPAATPPAAAPAATTPAATTPAAAPAPAPVKPKPKPKPAATAPAAPVAKSYTAAAGSHIDLTMTDSLNSRVNKVGQTFTASVANDVSDAAGHVVIPSGSSVTFEIVQLAAAKNKNAKDGVISVKPTQVVINGQTLAIDGTTDSVAHTLRGQGVTAGGAARVGGGAAAGAIAGRIIGGNKTGTIIGGIVGGAAGTAVAVQTADRDVIVAAGAPIAITLTSPLTVTK
ncbi:MAG: hypothetical protein ABJD11_14000 [Gemmatimonadota bacterium]